MRESGVGAKLYTQNPLEFTQERELFNEHSNQNLADRTTEQPPLRGTERNFRIYSSVIGFRSQRLASVISYRPDADLTLNVLSSISTRFRSTFPWPGSAVQLEILQSRLPHCRSPYAAQLD